MDQINLFDDFSNSTSDKIISTTNVVDSRPEPAQIEPAATDDTHIDCSRSNILVFAHKYQREMWRAFKHRRDCVMMVSRFAEFKDFGIKPMDQITAVDCIAYRSYLKENTTLNHNTINRHLSAVSACFRFAVEELQVMKDRPRVALIKTVEAATRAFTKAQVRQMIELHERNGDHWMAYMIKIGCLTGMRMGEIICLPLDIIEWDEETQELWLPPEITKTNKGRFISLAAEGAWEAAQWLRANIGREFTHRRFYDRWNDVKYFMGHGQDAWFKFHATRHFAATNMAAAGKNALTVAEQLGHSSIATTQKYYHGDARARAGAVSALSI